MKHNTRKPSKDILSAVAQITSKEADIRIPVSVHKEYVAYHNRIDCEEYNYKRVIEQSKKSLNNKIEDEILRKYL